MHLGSSSAAAQSEDRALQPISVPSPACQIRVARSIAEVERIRPIWSAWKGHRDSDIDFYLEFLQEHREVERPHVIVLYRNGIPDAMLVGRLESTVMKNQFGYLRFPGVRARLLLFSYGGWRGDGGEQNSRELVAAIMNSLRQGEADMALLHHPDITSPLYRAARHVPGFAARDRVPQPTAHHFMRLPQNMEQVYQGLSREHRWQLRKKSKLLLQKFAEDWKIRCFRETSEIEEAIRDVEEVAHKTYQRGLGVGFADTPEMRRRLDFCAKQGWLRAYVLYLGGRPCSFWVGTVLDGVFCSDYLSFDPAFAAYSPGTFLMTKVIEEFCQQGLREIDLGVGDGQYKERFGNFETRDASVYIFAPSGRGLLLNGVRTSTVSLEAAMRGILLRTHLLPTIKRIWRARAASKAA